MKFYLIGLPGSGKSFLGKKLADEIGIPFIDLDQVIEHEVGTTVREIFETKGEEYFRSLEAVALRQQSSKTEFVMACGGGTPCFHDNMKFIKQTGKSVFLNLPLSEIAERLKSEKESRPLLAETKSKALEQKLNALLEKRISFYNQATVTITNNTTPAEIFAVLKT